MKAINLIVIAILLGSVTSFGQNDRQNQEKYWYIRKQLTERFLRVGDKPGYNIPASKIHFAPAEWWNQLSPVQSRIHWGDGTINLGWYIAVLATELELMQQNSISSNKTTEELFWALETINRLDKVAEKVWNYYDEDDVPLCESILPCHENGETIPPDHTIPDSLEFVQENLAAVPYDEVADIWDPTNTSSSPNGFILRDDAPASILDDFEFPYTSMSSSMARPLNAYYGTAAPDGYRHNNYMSNGPPANEVSQDQLFSIFMGLFLVKEYCSDASYVGQNLGDKASTIAMRLLNHYNAGWVLKNPVRDKEVLIGGNSFFFASSLVNLKTYFTNSTKPIGAFPPQLPTYTTEVNRALSAIIMSISNSSTPLVLHDIVDEEIGWEFYSLLNNTLYGHTNNYYPLSDIKNDLNLCPCRGPYRENIQWTPDNTYMIGGNYWGKIWPSGVPEKWGKGSCLRTAEDQENDNDYHQSWGEDWYSEQYNGLDYMLLYNMYRINYGILDNFPYMDMRNNTIASGVLPQGVEGTTSNFRTYNSFGALETDLKMTVPVDNLPAGALMYARSIKFKPGFQVKAGARLVAQIHQDEQYECWSGTYRMAPVENPNRVVNRPEIIMMDNVEPVNVKTPDNSPKEDNQIIIFPNPAKDAVQVKGIDCIHNMDIINNTGVNVCNIKGTSNLIDLKGIPNGSYVIKITDCESKEHFAKLLVVSQ